MSHKLTAGNSVPQFKLSRAGGGFVDIGGARDAWQLIVVYRGRHCPMCKRFLGALNGRFDEIAGRNIEIVAISADPSDRAEADIQEFGWRFSVGFDMSLDDMRALGTYISEPTSPQETDRPFSEPALFLLTPQGIAQIIEIVNSPFLQPDLAVLVNGIRFIQDRDHPPRGTLE